MRFTTARTAWLSAKNSALIFWIRASLNISSATACIAGIVVCCPQNGFLNST
jgi:hypothetical protein